MRTRSTLIVVRSQCVRVIERRSRMLDVLCYYPISNVQHIQADRQRRALNEKILDDFSPSRATFGLNNADLSRLIDIVVEREDDDMGNYASQPAVDYMQAYYKNLPLVFNSEGLEKLADPQVANLPAEKQSSAIDHARNEEKLTNLVKASQELRRLDGHLLQLHGKKFGAFAVSVPNELNTGSYGVTRSNTGYH
ncbi:hypothetical protein LTR22_025796 [Elasticomyces elasticus]|nr:hypothetical protein LTR22_025796 [Elasticomyces elasticus]